jgi:hypothetical protein
MSSIRKSSARLAFIPFLLLASLATAQKDKKTSGPRLEVQPMEHDFGSLPQHETVVHEFTIVNAGTEELEIRRISTSCGCTAALTSDRSVPPGGTTTLKVTLETRKYRGAIERSVSIASNDPRRVHTVRVKAFVESSQP